ncbi:MAG: cellulose binding domain-containing protein, partial [Chitinophagales bacterium]
INNLWNGNWSGSQAEGYMVSNLNWNGVIDGGETVTIGFCADHDGSLLTPTDVTVSGMPTEITLNYTGDDPGTFIGANIQEPTSSIDLKLLPSVNNGAFQLELNAKQAANYQLAVFSSTGQMMALLEKDRLLMAQNALHYQLDLPNGLYYLQASNSLGAKAITKLVVVK